MIKNTLSNYLQVLAIIVSIQACTTEAADNKSETTPGNNRLPVDAVVARSASLIQEEAVPGPVLPNREVTIVSEIAKKIVRISFDEGSYITTGQTLYKLDDADILAKLKQVRSELSLAKLSESRLSELLHSESVRQEEYDVALSRLQSLEAAEELLIVELEKTSIRAPFSGVVGITKAQVGSFVTPGMPLVSLQEQHKIKIHFSVPEKYLSNIKIGSDVFFTSSMNEEKWQAKVIATESGIDVMSRSIIVHAQVNNPSQLLKPGMSAKVFFSTVAEGAKGIRLPTESLISGQDGYNVFTVKNGLAKLSPVTIGNRSESDALITSGLNDGDTVMVSNILKSSDGVPVQIVTIK